MKRQSYLRTPRRYGSGGLFRSAGKLAATVVGVLVVLALLVRLIAPGALTALAAPLWQVGGALSDKVGIGSAVLGSASLRSENERLGREVETLRNQNAILNARASDLERLLGGRTEHAGGTLAGVLARPPVSPYDMLVIDQGARDGITAGQTVEGPGGVSLGRVTEVNETTSRVTLYSTTGQATEGWAGETRIPVKLMGTGAGGFDAEISGTAGVKVGDQVYVPGPGALPIGTVVEVDSDPSSPTVVLRIRPLVNPASLTWVTILPL